MLNLLVSTHTFSGWFLRDFLYDPDGVVKISQTTVNGSSLLNFDGFAPR